MFLSFHESSVDAKKRVSVPASFRKSLAGEDSVFLWPSVNKSCLEGGGQKLVRKLRRAIFRMSGEQREAFQDRILGRGRFCRLDENGRIVLDPDLIEHAGLNGTVRFVGVGDRFQMWNPASHQSRAERLAQVAQQHAAELDSLETDEDFDDDVIASDGAARHQNGGGFE